MEVDVYTRRVHYILYTIILYVCDDCVDAKENNTNYMNVHSVLNIEHCMGIIVFHFIFSFSYVFHCADWCSLCVCVCVFCLDLGHASCSVLFWRAAIQCLLHTSPRIRSQPNDLPASACICLLHIYILRRLLVGTFPMTLGCRAHNRRTYKT